MNEQTDILFSVEGRIGRVHLHSPKSLNALSRDMCIAYRAKLLEWADDDTVRAVVVTGEGEKAFCAGGDVRGLYHSGKAGNPEYDFFWHEYRLDTVIHDFPKPHVALQDGVTMGGGLGISANGSHRIATDRTLYAMPETAIGLFPDVGATEFLPRAPGKIGMYLALTGARFHAADGIYARIATHFVPSANIGRLVDALTRSGLDGDAFEAVDGVLADFADDPGAAPLAAHKADIDRCFAAPSVAEILAALRRQPGDWARTTADDLETKSPTSVLVTFRQLCDYAGQSFKDIMRTEYRMACHFMDGHDFYEGIRAALVDKDRAPKWSPDRLDGVSDGDVEAYFTPHRIGELSFD